MALAVTSAHSSSAAPAATALPANPALAPASSLADAEAVTAALAHSHYENFSVVTKLLPRHLRQDFCNIYAFCRTADDLGDESPSPQIALDALARFRQQLDECYHARPTAVVFTALAATIARHNIPIEPFADLIDAFQQDQRITRYENFPQLLDYCRRSANPVGRLVLYLCGYCDPERQHLSDQTCTALQLANFWQDVRRDLLDLDRIYIPRDSMARFNLTEADLAAQIRQSTCDQRARDLIRFEVDRTATIFEAGDPLLPLLSKDVRPQISLFSKGGRAILQAIRNQNYDTLTHRPSLSSAQKMRLIMGALLGKFGGRA